MSKRPGARRTAALELLFTRVDLTLRWCVATGAPVAQTKKPRGRQPDGNPTLKVRHASPGGRGAPLSDGARAFRPLEVVQQTLAAFDGQDVRPKTSIPTRILERSGCSRRLALPLVLMLYAAACGFEHGDDDDVLDEAEELDPGGPLGKADGVGITSLPVTGSYASTRVWDVRNQWEDTDTPAAREAGLAWPADSGLTWDEKYGLWVESLERAEGFSVSQTFTMTTPWRKSLPAPRLDCADVALLLRASFAAWYNLPFFVVGFDKGKAVYFGHFGIRTSSGVWNGMPRFAVAYDDFSDSSLDRALESWPRDAVLRKRGVQAGDEQPFLGPDARSGAYLDEIHLNKRAGHFIRLLLVYAGSMHLADSRNTYNLDPGALRAGDVMLWRWQARGVGHTLLTVRADELGGGRLEAQSVYGNLPPEQPVWNGPVHTRLAYTNPQGGGHDGVTDYAPFNGGLKRFRVAKNVGGYWTNTFMNADEASWIDDGDRERMHQRPMEIDALLGDVAPEQMRDALLSIIEQRRAHLRRHPASCGARTRREEAFAQLYELMENELGTSRAQVDALYRTFEDYVFGELVYGESKTCCWNSSNAAMYDTIMSLNEHRQLEAGDACVEPIVFKARGGGYAIFRDHDPESWVPWSEDESCPQRGVVEDTEADSRATPFCAWALATEGSEGGGAVSCVGRCGDSSLDDSCFCDDVCGVLGDCCSDFETAC